MAKTFYLLSVLAIMPLFCGIAIAGDISADESGIIRLICVPEGAKSVPPQQEEAKAVNLTGPRIGLTAIFGALADELVTESKCRTENGNEICEETPRSFYPLISQFGWQLEKRFATSPDGATGVAEAVLLIGGAEQNVFLPSASFLIGFRTPKGVEIGIGPNVSAAGAALVLAGGITLKTGYLNVPINLAVVPSFSEPSGLRITLTSGFNLRKEKSSSY